MIIIILVTSSTKVIKCRIQLHYVLFWLLLSTGGRGCELLNDWLTSSELIGYQFVHAKLLCSVYHKASIYQTVFSFNSIGYVFIHLSNACNLLYWHAFVQYLSVNVLTKLHGRPSNLHNLLVKEKDFLIYKHVTPSQRNVSTQKAVGQWNNRTSSADSMQTRASQESNSVTVTSQVHMF